MTSEFASAGTIPQSRCVFFDRDGVVNRSPGEGYVLSPDTFILNDGIGEALRLLHENNILAILVTSQKCVGKGLISRSDLDAIHARMQELLAEQGAAFDAIYVNRGDGEADDYPAKPDPGMILAAAERFSIDLRQSWMIGDADRDISMARAARLEGAIRILGEKEVTVSADYSLLETKELFELLRITLKL